jgi:hypothetical protein
MFKRTGVIFSGFYSTLSAKHKRGLKKGSKRGAKKGARRVQKGCKKGNCEQPY